MSQSSASNSEDTLSSSPAAPKTVTQTTRVEYDQQSGLINQVTVDDGLTTHFCYYPVMTRGKADRSEDVPGLDALLKAFVLEGAATRLTEAMALSCPNIPDPSLPPLMAQCEYLQFPEKDARSGISLTLYGYANATTDSKGVLIPDTVLSLEGVAVDTSVTPWNVTKAPKREGIVVSLQQVATVRTGDKVETVTTATRWYKDNDARQARTLAETTTFDTKAGTVVSKRTAPLLEDGKTLTATLSHQVRSTRSGLVLRETQQDEGGQPQSMLYHRYDACDRLLGSDCYAWNEEAFAAGSTVGIELASQQIDWLETGDGTWVRTRGPDGRHGRTLLDGLQRPVRRELQRVEGNDHTDANYVCLEEVMYGADGEIERQCVYDYLPGGLCLRNEGGALSDNLRDWFWQAQQQELTGQAQGTETLTTRTTTGTLQQGLLHSLEATQQNHGDGQVTLTYLHKRWDAQAKAMASTGLSVKQNINAQGQLAQVTESYLAGTTAVERTWACVHDELGRRPRITTPDGTEVQWAYKGLGTAPIKITLTEKDGKAQQLGQQTLLGSSSQSDEVITRTVGGEKSTVTFSREDKKYRRPDQTRIWSERSDDGKRVEWYTDVTGSKAMPQRLVASFSYNPVTQVLHGERPESVETAGDGIRCDSTAPQLLGTYLSIRRVRGVWQQHQDQRSLRGIAGPGRHASGVESRAWQDRQNRRSRVRRGGLEYRYRYGAQGEIEQLIVLDPRSGRALELNFEYDSLGRETQRTYRLDGEVKSRYEQDWSEIGQLLKKGWYRNGEAKATRTETFTYHTLRNELERWSVEAVDGFAIEDSNGKALKAQAYSYDALGNVLSCTSTFADGQTETRTYSYSDQEQPTRRTRVSVVQSGSPVPVVTDMVCDANGSLTTNAQGQTLVYTYDGQLQSVWAGDKVVSSYEYDELGRLASQWDEGNQQRRVLQYSHGRLCGEVWLDAESKALERRVFDEEAGLAVHHMVLGDDGEKTGLYFILPDPQSGGGEEYRMDAQGQWQSQCIGFTPWGEAPLQRLNALNSGMGYNAQRVDPVTGSYHLGDGYRVYEPRHQAFYQSDSLSPFGEGGLNDRAYCAGQDPVNWHDPSGHIMVSRREQEQNLASLDQMIHETTPAQQHHEPAAWWEWALLVGGTALAVVGSIATGGALGVVFFAIAAVSFGLGAAALALRQSNPELSEKLELASMIVGFLDLLALPAMRLGGWLAKGVAKAFSVIRSLRSSALQGIKSLIKPLMRPKTFRGVVDDLIRSADTSLASIELGGVKRNGRVLSMAPNEIHGIGIFDDIVGVKAVISKNAQSIDDFARAELSTIKTARSKGISAAEVTDYESALSDAQTLWKDLKKQRDDSVALKKHFNEVVDKEHKSVMSAKDELETLLNDFGRKEGKGKFDLSADDLFDFEYEVDKFAKKYDGVSDPAFDGVDKLIKSALGRRPAAPGVSYWQGFVEKMEGGLKNAAEKTSALWGEELSKVARQDKVIGDALEKYSRTVYPRLKKSQEVFSRRLQGFAKAKGMTELSSMSVPKYEAPLRRLNFVAHGADSGGGATPTVLVRYELNRRIGVGTSPKKFLGLLGGDLKFRMKNSPEALKKITKAPWSEISDEQWGELVFKGYDRVRILACNIGLEEGGKMSYAQVFSNLIGKPVKAAPGRLFMTNIESKALFQRFKKAPRAGGFSSYFARHVADLNNRFAISKQPGMFGYHGLDHGIHYGMVNFMPT